MLPFFCPKILKGLYCPLPVGHPWGSIKFRDLTKVLAEASTAHSHCKAGCTCSAVPGETIRLVRSLPSGSRMEAKQGSRGRNLWPGPTIWVVCFPIHSSQKNQSKVLLLQRRLLWTEVKAPDASLIPRDSTKGPGTFRPVSKTEACPGKGLG